MIETIKMGDAYIPLDKAKKAMECTAYDNKYNAILMEIDRGWQFGVRMPHMGARSKVYKTKKEAERAMYKFMQLVGLNKSSVLEFGEKARGI